MLNIQQLSQMPQITTSTIRELQWTIDWNQKLYSESSLNKAQAWQLYNEAIDNENPRAEIEDLFAIAMMFECVAKEAWGAWQNAKRDYLALMN